MSVINGVETVLKNDLNKIYEMFLEWGEAIHLSAVHLNVWVKGSVSRDFPHLFSPRYSNVHPTTESVSAICTILRSLTPLIHPNNHIGSYVLKANFRTLSGYQEEMCMTCGFINSIAQ